MKMPLLLASMFILFPIQAGESSLSLDLTKAKPDKNKPIVLATVGEGEVEWSLPDGKGRAVTFDLKALGVDRISSSRPSIPRNDTVALPRPCST